MRKLLLTACVALASLCTFAQEKGDMAVGLNLGAAPCLESGVSLTNFGIGAKFQYNVTTPIRLEADVDYWFKSKGVDVFDVTANVHYLFNIGDKLKVYPLVGIGYAHIGGGFSSDINDFIEDIYDEYDHEYGTNIGGDEVEVESSSASKFLFNVGAGAQYDLTSNIAVGLEVKYQYIKDFSRLPISLGVTYKF